MTKVEELHAYVRQQEKDCGLLNGDYYLKITDEETAKRVLQVLTAYECGDTVEYGDY